MAWNQATSSNFYQKQNIKRKHYCNSSYSSLVMWANNRQQVSTIFGEVSREFQSKTIRNKPYRPQLGCFVAFPNLSIGFLRESSRFPSSLRHQSMQMRRKHTFNHAYKGCSIFSRFGKFVSFRLPECDQMVFLNYV